MDGIIDSVVLSGCTPVNLQEIIRKKTGIKIHITYVKKTMQGYGLIPKRP